jgi:nicotinamide-nucleotide amidase
MRTIRSAEIVAVGSELLTPFRSDTNSLWLTEQLNAFGIEVRVKTVVGDDIHDLTSVLCQSLSRADLVITTGGLGPTADDLTREAVSEVLERPLAPDADVLTAIRARFESRGMVMPEINARQALVPAGAEVLVNTVGTAPGLWMEVDPQVCVLLPGPPRELQPMFLSQVAPRLDPRTGARRLRRRVIVITGKPESQVDEIAQPIYSMLAHDALPVATTILASPGRIELHLSASGSDVAALDDALESGVSKLASALGRSVVSTEGRRLEQVVADLLLARGLRLAVAESCTGGLVLAGLTDIPGSSAWLMGGVVAYDNAVKIDVLGVPAALIEAHGAVSEPVASAMANGARQRLAADVGIGITGIAGPAGGTPEKPVGTVVIALEGPESVVRTFKFGGNRAMVRQFSVAAALDMLRRALN